MNEVVRIKEDLTKAHQAGDGDKVMELLQLLVNMPISTQVLQDTHIGATVNAMRKSCDMRPEAQSLSKKLVRKWKKLVEAVRETNDSGKSSKKKEATRSKDNASANNNTTTTTTTTNTNNNNNSLSNNNGNSGSSSSSTNGPGSNNNSNSNSASNNTSSNSGDAADRISPTETKSQDQSQPKQPKQESSTGSENPASAGTSSKGVKREAPAAGSRPSFVAKEIPHTSSEVRLKFRQMITEALKHPLPKELQTNEPFLDEESLAARIEDCVFQEFKSDTDLRYRNRVRGRISNLKDKNNPYLRLQVLRGDISAERMAKMTPEEMASDELKRQREQFHREAINDHQMALTGGTSSSEIKCPACKKYDCSYNQMQTRSADEPMTTFCHCNNCGKRWKFC